MCVSKILHYSEHGCVSVCSECHQVQISFGTTVTTHAQKEFIEYCAFVKKMLKKYAFADNKYEKKVYIKTSVENLSLLYSTFDLENLDDLLSQSLLVLSAHHILEAENASKNN